MQAGVRKLDLSSTNIARVVSKLRLSQPSGICTLHKASFQMGKIKKVVILIVFRNLYLYLLHIKIGKNLVETLKKP